jgi:hypothetical protein
MKSSFLMKTSVLVFTLLISPFAFAGKAGTVTFKAGDVSIIRADKTVINAEKNTAVNAGDTIETRDGRLQLALIDGGKVSLQPNTIYRINKYEFSGKEDGTEYGFTELIKGGLRTISGLIGHKNRERYQLKTAVATIGIRGTEFIVNFNDNNLLMTTSLGSVDVCNEGGCLNATTGQSISVKGVGAKPKPSDEKATAAATPPESNKVVFAVADPANDAGIPNIIVGSAAANATSGETIVSLATMQTGLDNNGVYVGTTTYTGNAGNGPNPNAGNSPNGNALSTYTDNSGSPIIVTGTILEANSDGIVKWGRASGGTYNGQPMLMTTWITGIATPSAAITGLALANSIGSYNVVASTAPYLVSVANGANVISAVGAPNSVSGALDINFSNYTFTYNLTVPIAGTTFSAASSGTLIAGSAKFKDIASGIGVLSGSSIIEGSLYGANAQAAGLQYGFNVTSPNIPNGNGNLYGNAVLQTCANCNAN